MAFAQSSYSVNEGDGFAIICVELLDGPSFFGLAVTVFSIDGKNCFSLTS